MTLPKPYSPPNLWFSLATVFFTGALAAAEVVPLDGTWLVEETVAPDAMPASFPFWGSDGEKGPWTPGIYDHVEVRFADNPVIEEVQVAPRIASGEIVVQTRLKNFGAARAVEFAQHIISWKSKRPAGDPVRQQIQLAAGEEKTITQTVPVPNAVLWSPDTPFLYFDFWQPALAAGAKRSYRVTLVNDPPAPLRGRLTVAWQAARDGKVVSQTEQAFEVPAAGLSNCNVELAAPSGEGLYQLTATASCDGQRWSPTLSRRQVTICKIEAK